MPLPYGDAQPYGAPVPAPAPAPEPAADPYANGYAQPMQSAPYDSYGYGQPPAPEPVAAPYSAPPASAYGDQPPAPTPAPADYAADPYGQPYDQQPYDQQPYAQQPYDQQPGQPSAYGAPAYGDPGTATGPAAYGTPEPAAAPYGAPPAYGNYAQPSAGWAGEPPLNQPYYGISFGAAIQRFFKKYATFSGRASRSEFWWSYLFVCIVNSGLSIFGTIFETLGFSTLASFFNMIAVVWGLATLVPTIAIYVRRLHDTNKPGTLAIIPYALYGAGTVVLFVVLGGIILALVTNPSSVDFAAGAVVGMIGGVIACLALYLAGFVVWLIFAIKGSDPQGARFDR